MVQLTWVPACDLHQPGTLCPVASLRRPTFCHPLWCILDRPPAKQLLHCCFLPPSFQCASALVKMYTALLHVPDPGLGACDLLYISSFLFASRPPHESVHVKHRCFREQSPAASGSADCGVVTSSSSPSSSWPILIIALLRATTAGRGTRRNTQNRLARSAAIISAKNHLRSKLEGVSPGQHLHLNRMVRGLEVAD